MYLSDVIVKTSITFKGKIAPKGLIFYIATLKDKKNNMIYTLHQLANRKGATQENEVALMDAMKKKLLSDVSGKMIKA